MGWSSLCAPSPRCCIHRALLLPLLVRSSRGLAQEFVPRTMAGPSCVGEGLVALTWSFSCFQIIPNFYPPLEAHVRQGVFNSLTHIVEKRVLA